MLLFDIRTRTDKPSGAGSVIEVRLQCIQTRMGLMGAVDGHASPTLLAWRAAGIVFPT